MAVKVLDYNSFSLHSLCGDTLNEVLGQNWNMTAEAGGHPRATGVENKTVAGLASKLGSLSLSSVVISIPELLHLLNK